MKETAESKKRTVARETVAFTSYVRVAVLGLAPGIYSSYKCSIARYFHDLCRILTIP